MPSAPARHSIAIAVLDGTLALDVAVALQAFGPRPTAFLAMRDELESPYDVYLCGGPDARLRTIGMAVRDLQPWSRLVSADTVVVPGLDEPDRRRDPDALAAVAAAADRGARIVALCAGALRGRVRRRGRRSPSDHPLGPRRPVPRPLPASAPPGRRALRRRRQPPQLGRHAGRRRSVPAHPAPRPRAGLRQRCRPPPREPAVPDRRPVAVPDERSRGGQRVVGAAAGLGRRAPPRAADGAGARVEGEHEHAHPVPPVRRRDRTRRPAVDQRTTRRPGPDPPRGDRPERDRRRVRHRVRLARRLPSPVRPHDRHDASHLPHHVPRDVDATPARSGRLLDDRGEAVERRLQPIRRRRASLLEPTRVMQLGPVVRVHDERRPVVAAARAPIATGGRVAAGRAPRAARRCAVPRRARRRG